MLPIPVMAYSQLFIIVLCIAISKEDEIECNISNRLPDETNCSRFQECHEGTWVVANCKPGHSFDTEQRICVPGDCFQELRNTTSDPNATYLVHTDGYQVKVEKAKKELFKKHRSTRSDDSEGIPKSRRRRGTTYKSFRSYTTRRGSDVRTTLWYYNSDGPNYKFTIFGELPTSREKMIEWLERNSNNYNLTPVPYKGDAEETSAPPRPSYPTEPPRTRPPPTPPPRPPPTQTPKPSRPPPQSWREILPSNCGYSGNELKHKVNDKVIAGVPVPIEDNPWQVALVEKNTKSLSCGGSIISKQHVLTASHCFVQERVIVDSDGTRRKEPRILSKSSFFIFVGSSNINEGYISFTILDLFLHDKYRSSHKRNDIALILVNGDFVWSAKVYPICIPEKTANYIADRSCRISGWGKTLSESSRTEDFLHGAVVKIVNSADCKRENEQHLTISRGMFCAGDYKKGGVDTCQGDSGGPCTCEEEGRGTLFGITSWGIGCGREKYPGVYAKVAEYRKWILDRLEVSMGSKSRDSLTYDEDIGAEDDVDKAAEPENEDPDEDII